MAVRRRREWRAGCRVNFVSKTRDSAPLNRLLTASFVRSFILVDDIANVDAPKQMDNRRFRSAEERRLIIARPSLPFSKLTLDSERRRSSHLLPFFSFFFFFHIPVVDAINPCARSHERNTRLPFPSFFLFGGLFVFPPAVLVRPRASFPIIGRKADVLFSYRLAPYKNSAGFSRCRCVLGSEPLASVSVRLKEGTERRVETRRAGSGSLA